jgi:hypothetical protein
MNSREIYGKLARLLSNENLTVLHKANVDTASFDIKGRILTLPMWEGVSDSAHQMLVSKEVGHALYTPMHSLDDYPGISPACINIVEDARVEKLIKRRYPGMRRTFYDGYKFFHSKDWFGLGGKDINELSLLDRINLHFKIGSLDNVDRILFTEDEKSIVDEIAACETFEHVLEVARKLQDQSNEDHSKNEESNSVDSDSTSKQGEVESESTSEQGEVESESTSEQGEVESQTESSLSEALKKLVKNDSDIDYVTIPELKVDNHIISHDRITRELGSIIVLSEKISNGYAQFKSDARKEVSYLVKEFVLKQAADAYARIQESKTGVLDTSKIHTYQYNDDVFKKSTTVPEGKNHGLIFILDWSGSMRSRILDTCKQLFKLIWFCRRVNIPFEVYAFSTEYPIQASYTVNANQIIPKKCALLNFISSKVKAGILDEQMRNLYYMAYCITNGSLPAIRYSLGLTPLNDTLILLKDIIPSFIERNIVQKLNCIIMTDGESDSSEYRRALGYYSSISNDTWLLDDKLKTTYNFGHNNLPYTDTFIRNLCDAYPDVNFIGMRILGKSRSMVEEFIEQYVSDKKIINSLIDKFMTNNSCSIKSSAYTSYFAIAMSNSESSSSRFVSLDQTMRDMRLSTNLLSEFISIIA